LRRTKINRPLSPQGSTSAEISMLDGPDVRAGSIPAEQPLRQVGRGHWNPPAAAWRWRCAFPAKLPACCAARSQRDCLEARHHDHACKSAPGPRELDAKMPSWRFATRIDRSLRNLPNPQEERVSGSQKTPAWWHSSHRCLQRRAGSCNASSRSPRTNHSGRLAPFSTSSRSNVSVPSAPAQAVSQHLAERFDGLNRIVVRLLERIARREAAREGRNRDAERRRFRAGLDCDQELHTYPCLTQSTAGVPVASLEASCLA